jgi:hypothetical protein
MRRPHQKMTRSPREDEQDGSAAAKATDPAVRRALVESRQDLLAFLRRRLRSREEADEVLQRFSLRALEHASETCRPRLNADEAVPQSEKKNLLEELKAALKAAEPIQFPMNIELVKKYYDKLGVTTISISDDDSRSSSAVRTIRE